MKQNWIIISFCYDKQANWRQTTLSQLKALKAGRMIEQSGVVQASGCFPDLKAIQVSERPLKASVQGFQSMFLYKRWCRSHMNVSSFLPTKSTYCDKNHDSCRTLAIVDASKLSIEQFEADYDLPAVPCILQNAVNSWPVQKWTFDHLSEHFGAIAFGASRPTGGSAPMLMKDFVDYMKRQSDEEPLYIFDKAFAERAPEMLSHFSVPSVFHQDLMSCLGNSRPPYRWLVAGPARSGATWHVDPHLTSAWNALIHGRKRWALYPPHITPPGVDPDSYDTLTSLQWLLEVYPTLPSHLKPLEFIQEPGEVVFVPGGWWHCILNLEPSVAITQNFVSKANLRRCIQYMSRGSQNFFEQPLEYFTQDVVEGWGQWCDGLSTENKCLACSAEKREKERGISRRSELIDMSSRRELLDTVVDVGHAQKRAKKLAAEDQQYEACPFCKLVPANGGPGSASQIVPLICPHITLLGSGGDDKARAADSKAHRPNTLIGDSPLSLSISRWKNDSYLCSWVRCMLRGYPELRSDIMFSLESLLDFNLWSETLQQLCTTLQKHNIDVNDVLPDDQPIDFIPSSGASSLVFLLRGLVLKIYTAQDLALSAMESCLDAFVPIILSTCNKKMTVTSYLGPMLPSPICQGLMHFSPSLHSTEGGHAVLPFVVFKNNLVECRHGVTTLQDALSVMPEEHKENVAHVLGLTCGAMHMAGLHAKVQHDDPPCAVQTWPVSTVAEQHDCLAGRLQISGHGDSLDRVTNAYHPVIPPHLETHHRHGALGSESIITYVSLWRQRLSNALDGCQHAMHQSWVFHDTDGSIWHSSTKTHSGNGNSRESSVQCEPQSSPQDASPAWIPFISFLRSQRSKVMKILRDDGRFPEWLVVQVHNYLPEDPAFLIGIGVHVQSKERVDEEHGKTFQPAMNPCSLPIENLEFCAQYPILLHGDLLPCNVFLVDQGFALKDHHVAVDNGYALNPSFEFIKKHMRIIDFADSGHGDPLFDLVKLFGGGLKLEPNLMKKCWKAYKSDEILLANWPQRNALCSLSYVAMCYCLLTQEDILTDCLFGNGTIMQLVEEGGLLALQAFVWGFLDE
ncbi:hypothetical protein CEUSTIGMA_g945.t1 [Chlamydomonas eustigma]|uniref:JmjC domain-containing protein n=1 Tax=Chlamydomonas eustigma TaxID=1157962 RepID=A0A250WRQ4_9CHLO|nr:hypothetical protein CEUSTIGMA_g945.t1 [Chlamydomonas eustigma]|eukprot:GAX73493.1 hypothetical protein CEUSTIGMA_g945.t1 [Chlamydomonas eustigma]